MITLKKHVSKTSLFAVLFFLSPVSVSQMITSSDDILEFLPAIIVGVTNENEVSPPTPEPPISDLGNYRFTKTEAFNRLQPKGKMSELISSWDSLGNNVEDNLMVFDLFGGNPSEVNLTVVSNTKHDEQNRPLSSSYTSTIDTDTQESATKQYRYQNGKLQSTSSESILTSSVTGSTTTNIETVFQYAGSNRLIGATVTASQPNNSIVSTEQHYVGYDSNNRVSSHRVVRSSNITNTPEETLHSHRYDSAGNLLESVTITPTNLEIIKTFQPITGNQTSSTILVTDKSTGTVNSSSLIIGTYEVGICVLIGPNSPIVIEGNITASFPYSPNVGCIKR